MAAVAVADSLVGVDDPLAVAERLEAFGIEVLCEAVNRPVQLANGGVYLRGLIEDGARKSLEPMVARMGGDADYESLQNFLAVSTWDPALVVRAVAERVAPRIAVQAWVLDDTGFPKDGKHSPGVKRQYSGTLGKIGNCQIGVSVHAVGANGTVPLGWSLYLPEEWCDDPERRRKAKIPAEVEFKTKPQLGKELIERAGEWDIQRAPVLGDEAYGENTRLRQDSTMLVFSTCSRSTRRRACSRPRRRSPCQSVRGRQAAQGHGCVLTASLSPSKSSSRG